MIGNCSGPFISEIYAACQYLKKSNVSEKFIMNRIASLDNMMSIDANKVELKKLQKELIKDTETASEGIRNYIRKDETSLQKKLVDRKNQIMDEYQFMIDCISPEDREFKN